MPQRGRRWVTASLVGLCLVVVAATQATGQELEKDEIRRFMLSAAVVAAEPIGKGVTQPWRLTLSDGDITHDVAFQSVDERATRQRLGAGQELGFVDAYRYNIAAYHIAELLGIDHMMPVTVEREWRGQRGAMTWWIDDVAMDEQARLSQRIWPDDMQTFNQQYYRMLVFAELVYDTDRNQGNVLYGSDWKLWMIDFSRAFRIWGDLQAPGNVTRVDRSLLDRMRDLTRDRIEAQTGPHLNGGELDAVIERRDKLVDHFDTLVEEKGEALVLY